MAKTRVLRIAAKREGFRRAGRVFGAVAQDIAVDSLSAAERAAIENDPGLVVAEVEIEAPAPEAVEAEVTTLAEPGENAGAEPAVSAPTRKRK